MRPYLTALVLVVLGVILASSTTASPLAAAPATFFANGAFSDRPENLDSVLTLYAMVKAQPQQDAIIFQDGPQIWGNQLTVLMTGMGTRPLDEPTARYAMELAIWAATAEASDDPEETQAALLNQRIPERITRVQYRDLQTLRRAWTAGVH